MEKPADRKLLAESIMNKIYRPLLRHALAILFGHSLIAQPGTGSTIPTYIPTDGLVGWWPSNGNANDESGNGNDGVVHGAGPSLDRFGKVNSAYNTLSGPVDVSNNLFENGWNDYTIGIWLDYDYLNATDGNCLINTVPHGGFALGYGYFGSNKFSHIKASNIPGSSWDNFSADRSNASDLPSVTWHHFVCVKEGNTYRYFVDGMLDRTIRTTGPGTHRIPENQAL